MTEDTTEELDDRVETESGEGILRSAFEWTAVVVIAVVAAFVIRTFLVQSFWIESGSMEETLMISDRVMVNHLSYQFGSPSRGDIVVFTRPGDNSGGTKDLIKRVVAVPGEEVEGRDGAVYIDGERLDEPYLNNTATTSVFAPLIVPDDHVWLMGDNRTRSNDSRDFGPIPASSLKGRAFIRFWPLDRFGRP